MSAFTTGLQLSHQATQLWFTHGELWGLEKAVAWEPHSEREVMLPGYGVLKLEVQMECAQWACICRFSLWVSSEVGMITEP